MPIASSQSEMRRIFQLAIPLVISNIAMLGVEIVDTIMAGQASNVDLAGLLIGVSLCSVLLGIRLFNKLKPASNSPRYKTRK